MRICMIDPFFHPYQGGTEKHVFEIGRRLAREHEIHVITSHHLKRLPMEEEIEGMHVHRMRSLVIYRLPSFLPPPFFLTYECPHIYYKLGRKHRFDLFHLHNRFSPILDTIIFAKQKMGMPMLLTIHNSRPKGIDRMTDWLGGMFDDTIGRHVIDAADGIISVSDFSLRATAPYYRRFRRVIPNGIDTKKHSPRDVSKGELGLPDKKMILFVGRLLPQKGIRYLIRAYTRLRKTRDDVQLVIVGRGPDMMKLRRMNPEVVFRGYIPEEELIMHYQACDVFALPSLYEPFGMVLTEAMACGKPVVASSTGGIPEIVDDGVNGFLSPPRDVRGLVRNLNILIEDEGLRNRIGKEARKKCENVFEWDIVARETERFYTEFLDKYTHA